MEKWTEEEVASAKSIFISASDSCGGSLNKAIVYLNYRHNSFLEYVETPNFMNRGLLSTKGKLIFSCVIHASLTHLTE